MLNPVALSNIHSWIHELIGKKFIYGMHFQQYIFMFDICQDLEFICTILIDSKLKL